MFVHHVFFWLKDPNDAHRDQLVQGLRDLLDIPGIQSAHIGCPADTDRPVIERSYAVSWLLIFADADAEAVYQDHPKHHAFVHSCNHLWERVVVYDSVSIG